MSDFVVATDVVPREVEPVARRSAEDGHRARRIRRGEPAHLLQRRLDRPALRHDRRRIQSRQRGEVVELRRDHVGQALPRGPRHRHDAGEPRVARRDPAASMPPRLRPTTTMRAGSIRGSARRNSTAASASSITSSSTVKARPTKLSGATFCAVVAQHRDAQRREPGRQVTEGLVGTDRLVAVTGAGAVHQHHGRTGRYPRAA